MAPSVPRVRRPSAMLALTELPRAFAELAALPLAAPLLATAPRGDGHPVLVLPGFAASDRSTAVLRGFLADRGYDVYAWELGRNLGPRSIGREGEKLVDRLRAVNELTGRKVSMVGWSLGGVMARLVARRTPEKVRQLISLGSPFAGDPRSTNVWRMYQILTGQRIDDDHTQDQLSESATPPPVPSTSIYSREDGVVAWQNCIEPRALETDNIEVHGSHCGLAVNASVLYAIADRLAQPDGEWRPFARDGIKGFVYPSAGHS